MRTLSTLRNSCLDGQNTYECTMSTNTADVTGTSMFTVCSYTNQLDKGFYLMSGSVVFEYLQSKPFPLSKVHEMLVLDYLTTDGSTKQLVIDLNNSFGTTNGSSHDYVAGLWHINKLIYIDENVGSFKCVMVASEFDGANEEVILDDTSATSVVWRDDFAWDDVLLTNTNTTTDAVIEDSLTLVQLGEDIEVVSEGSVFNVSVQVQCFTEVGYADAGLSAGPVTLDSSLASVHLILKKNDVVVNESSIESALDSSGVYSSSLTIDAKLVVGTYKLYASGCGYYSGGAVSHIGNGKGIIDLLVSRTLGQAQNLYNEDASLSYASMAEPVETTTEGGIFLSQTIAQGVQNLPPYKVVGDMSSMTLSKIF